MSRVEGQMSKQLLDGKGVSRTTAFRVPPEDLLVIGHDTKHRSMADHPHFDPRVLNVHANISEDDPDVMLMVEIGVQEAVKVEVDEIDGKEVWVVTHGRGRTLRARIANRILKRKGMPAKTVPVVATRKTETTTKLGVLTNIVLNEHRENDTWRNRAEKAQYLLATGYDMAQVAGVFRMSVQTIADWLKVLDASAATQKAVEDGVVSASAAAKLSGLSKDEQATALAKLAEGGGKATVKAVAAVARNKKNGVTTEAIVAPSKRSLRRVVKDGQGVLSDDFIRGVRVALGDLDPKSIKGLTAILSGEAEAAE